MAGTKVVVGLIFCIVLPGCLQIVGVYKEEWAASPNSTCPFVRLKGNVCGEDYEVIHSLEFYPGLMYLLPVMALVMSICSCFGDGEDAAICALMACLLWVLSILFVVIFPFAGILILTGCIMFTNHFPLEDLRLSFFLCLSAGCLHTLGMLYIIINCCYKCNRKPEEQYETVMVPVRTVSGAIAYREETIVVHDESNGDSTTTSRKLTILSIFE